MTVFLQAFFEGFTGGSLLSWAELPGAPNQVFADENSEQPQRELMHLLLKQQEAEEQQGKKEASIFDDDFFWPTVSASQTSGTAEGHPDVALVERARAGDPSAFQQLVRRHERLLFRAALHITQNREEATRLLSETLKEAEQGTHGT